MDINDIEVLREDEIPEALRFNPEEEIARVEKGREKAASRLERSPSVIVNPTPAPAARIVVVPSAPAAPASTVARVFRPPKRTEVVSAPAELAGDRKALIQGYSDVSICNTLVNNAIGRAKVAASMLDEKHRQIILTEIRSAEMKNANAAHKGIRKVPLKRAVAIALKAEQWVYQAQAAAAKHANKEAQMCRRKLSGKHKLTKDEKDARYLKVYGVARPSKAERTRLTKERARAKRAAVVAAKRQ